MEFFEGARTVRLKGYWDKYLWASSDRKSIAQNHEKLVEQALWRVQRVADSTTTIRLISCFESYLTASDQPFLLGMTGKKAVQSRPKYIDSSVEWEPVREGQFVKLRTTHGNFLRANNGFPPWRNSVTHDVPYIVPQHHNNLLWTVEDVTLPGIKCQDSGDSRKASEIDRQTATRQVDRSDSRSSTSSLSDADGDENRKVAYLRRGLSASSIASPKRGGPVGYYHSPSGEWENAPSTPGRGGYNPSVSGWEGYGQSAGSPNPSAPAIPEQSYRNPYEKYAPSTPYGGAEADSYYGYGSQSGKAMSYPVGYADAAASLYPRSDSRSGSRKNMSYPVAASVNYPEAAPSYSEAAESVYPPPARPPPPPRGYESPRRVYPPPGPGRQYSSPAEERPRMQQSQPPAGPPGFSLAGYYSAPVDWSESGPPPMTPGRRQSLPQWQFWDKENLQKGY